MRLAERSPGIAAACPQRLKEARRMSATTPITLRDSLAEGAAEIDRTFARAGLQLGDGLALIGGHDDSLASVATVLSDGQLIAARSSLASVALEMGETRARFADETASLMQLAARSNEVGDLFERLKRNMRVVTIVTRSARIEGSSVDRGSSDFGDFTDEIFKLTNEASQTVEGCLRDHHVLSASLTATLAAQRDFELQFGPSLTTISNRILEALEALTKAAGRDAELVARLAERSGRVARATGEAIILLQSGDNIRQRLEHVANALDVDCSGQPPAATVLVKRIQSAQLAATADMLKQDCRKIDATLALLANEAYGLVELFRKVYGGDGSSVLDVLEAQLGEAARLLRQCEAARQAVDGVVNQLTQVLADFERTMGRLTKTVADIVLIGINAGLKATRLGGAGRSLVIVALQLKGTADEIAHDAARLRPVFALMSEDAAALRDRARQSERLVELDDSIAQGFGVIRSTGEHLASIFEQVERGTSRYLDDVRANRSAFAATAGRSAQLAAIASNLSGHTRGAFRHLDKTTASRVRSFLLGALRSRYSMAAEREIFDRVLYDQELTSLAPEPSPADDPFTLFA